MAAPAPERLDIQGVSTEIIRQGRGAPLLFLHPEIGFDGADSALAGLAGDAAVIAPSHPGFGKTDLPKGMTTVDDIAYFYLDLMEQLDLRDVTVVGVGFGGWIAAEIAVKTTQRMSHLVLADAFGIKTVARDQRDIVDMHAITRQRRAELSFVDPARGQPDYAPMSDDALRTFARNAESFTWFGWQPYMHNPKLAGRLHRIRVPTLLLWGEQDGIVTPDYGRAYAKLIAGSQFRLIKQAAHFPHIEQPEVFADEVRNFVGRRAAA